MAIKWGSSSEYEIKKKQFSDCKHLITAIIDRPINQRAKGDKLSH